MKGGEGIGEEGVKGRELGVRIVGDWGRGYGNEGRRWEGWGGWRWMSGEGGVGGTGLWTEAAGGESGVGFREWLDKKGRAPSLLYFKIWGCPDEAKKLNPQTKKFDSRTISCYFIGNLERSKGYQFYFPNHTTRIVKTNDAEFLENGEISGSGESIDLNEKLMDAPNQELSIPLYMKNITIVPCDEVVDILVVNAPPHDENQNPPIIQQPLRRSERTRRPVVHDDFITYLNEDDYDLGKVEDPIFYKNAIKSNQSTKWLEAMNDELKSIQINDVWELTELPNRIKPVGCKWVYKTKLDPKGNIKIYKARLVAKGYTQKEGIDYNETFSPVSREDSLRIVMALVAHYDLELHQMDVKTKFLNGDLHEDVYDTTRRVYG
ncbi:retrovirus-related pol polyprotein from transposon TNT 1-94 [Tanacetum coccineum]